MSEVQKPVEEPVVATTTETPTLIAPAPESKPVEETPIASVEAATETPAVTEITPVSEAEPVKEEVKPVEEGVLGYKAPGLIKSLMFSKKHFWFGAEPIEHKSLSNYLRGEKPEVGNHNAAWASHTGKGLLFFGKKDSDKTSPAGVINLSDISEPVAEGPVEFFFTVHGHKNTFQAATQAERDNWVSTIKTKITEAKESSESVTSSETYKKTHSTLSPPVVAAATPKKSSETTPVVEPTPIETTAPSVPVEKARKDRSASRKRNSIFGSIGFGKKEEKIEASEETPIAPAAADETTPVVEPTPIETAPVVESSHETVAPVVPAEKPAASKRNSIFGTLQSRFSASNTPKEKKSEEAAPAVPAKDAEPVSETAPIIPAVETTEPLATSVASPATVPTETTTVPSTEGEIKAVEAPTSKSDKRKSSLPFFGKKEKTATSDEEVEKPKSPSPFAKLRATVKGKTSPKAVEKPAEETVEPAIKEAEVPQTTEIPAVAEPVVSEPVPAVQTSTPQVSATA